MVTDAPALGGDMAELEGDVAASDKRDPLRQLFQVEELVAAGQMLFANDVQADRPRAGRNHHLRPFEDVVAHLNRAFIDKPRTAVKGFDARFQEAILPLLRERVRKRRLEADQLRPIDPNVPRDAPTRHPGAPVDDLRRTRQNLLRITAPEPTGAPEGPGIDDRHLLARRPATQRRRRARLPRPDHDKVKHLLHDRSSWWVRGQAPCTR